MYNKLIKRAEEKFSVYEILNYFQDSAIEHGTQIGVCDKKMAEQNNFWVILRTKFIVVNNKEVNEINNITYPKVAGKIDFDREYIISSNEEVLVKGISKWILMDLTSRKLSRKHNVVLEGSKEDGNFDGLVKLDINEDNLVFTNSYNVTSKDLDKNNHVNNASYANIISSVYDTSNVVEFQIDYLNEIFNDSIIDIYMYESDYTYILGKCNNKNCFIAKIKGE